MMRTTGVALLALFFIASCSTAPAPQQPGGLVAPVYTSDAGELAVGVIPAGTLADTARNRRLELAIEYPIRAGSYPLVIFSTGFGIPNRSYVALSSYWASHGYVVVKVGHPDTRPENTEIAEVWRDQTPETWRARARDISFVIDSIPALQQQYPELGGKIDLARIGVSGHSVGAFTAMLLSGVRTFSGATAASQADPRVKAAVVMSPVGPGESRGLTTESWREVRLPVMYMTGSADRGVTEQENEEWRRQAFELSPAGDKWFVSIAGANHYAFAGRVAVPVAAEPAMEPALPADTRDPRNPRVVPPSGGAQPYPARRVDRGFYNERAVTNVIRTVSLAFWDTYLKNEPRGREYLSRLNTRGDMTVASK